VGVISGNGFAQEDNLNKQLELLIRVQEIDTEIQQSEEIKKKYYDDSARMDEELKREADTVVKEKEDLQNLEKEHRRIERALEELQTRREKAQDKLFSIKTNKEYQAALHEIETIKQSIQKQEDEILEIMVKLDSVKGCLKQSEEQLKKIEAEYAQKKKQIEQALNTYLKEIEIKKDMRASLTENITPSALHDYITLIEAKHGLAVVKTQNELCLGCNMKIPPQTYNLVITSDEIIFCPNCRRMLYIPSEPDQNTP
jgi:hypothetical protein